MPTLPRLKLSPKLIRIFVPVALSIVFGLAWYLLLYGHYPLYPSHVNFIYTAGGDALQHQLGWEFFRQEPWRFPLGSIAAYGYPFGTSLTFLDSIPLFAIPFKLLSPWLGQNFQYFGLWELVSVIGQMLLGLLILNEFTRSHVLKILGASLLVLSPPMIFRAFYHNSLSAHWILLAGIWFILLARRMALWRGAWIVLFGLATLIHSYFVPMLLPLWAAGLYYQYKDKTKKWGLAFDIPAVVVVVGLAGYSTGLFSLGYDSLAASGYGVWSWNLNGFFNPLSFSSAFLKELPTGVGGQYEGYSYLGLGNLLLVPPAVYVFLQKGELRKRLKSLWPLVAAALVLALFALSHQAFLGTQPLWDIPLPGPVLNFFNLFRTSGRFIWPVYYLLVLFGLVGILRSVRWPIPILALALVLQFADLQPLIDLHRLTGFSGYQSGLTTDFWQPAAENNQHLVIIPAKKLTKPYEPLALYAAHNGLTLNLGYFARSDTRAFQDYASRVWEDLKAGRVDDQTIYILTDAEWVKTARETLGRKMLICEMDGYTALFSGQNEMVKMGANFPRQCSMPVP